MNKRQAKKAYKKKYGHNPPKEKEKRVNPKALAELVTVVMEAIKPVFELLWKIFEELEKEFEKISEVMNGWEELPEKKKVEIARRYAIEERSKKNGRASIQVAEALAQKRRKERRLRLR